MLGLKRVFSSITSLFSSSFHNFAGDLPRIESMRVYSNLAGSFLFHDILISQFTVSSFFISSSVSVITLSNVIIFLPEFYVVVLELFDQINAVCHWKCRRLHAPSGVLQTAGWIRFFFFGWNWFSKESTSSFVWPFFALSESEARVHKITSPLLTERRGGIPVPHFRCTSLF